MDWAIELGDYVLALKGDVLERRAVKTGTSSVTLVQVTGGLEEGDAVALPSDVPVKPGDRVTAVVEPRQERTSCAGCRNSETIQLHG